MSTKKKTTKTAPTIEPQPPCSNTAAVHRLASEVEAKMQEMGRLLCEPEVLGSLADDPEAVELAVHLDFVDRMVTAQRKIVSPLIDLLKLNRDDATGVRADLDVPF